MKWKYLLSVWVVGLLAPAVWAADAPRVTLGSQPYAGLTNATILIVRHAEKPASGVELAPLGVMRSLAYVQYFQHLKLDGQLVKVDDIICTADSKGSERPRLTIQPLSEALKLPLDNRFKDKDAALLGAELRAKPHGRAIVICWHHGEIPELIDALGGNAAAVLPQSTWPDTVFGWMIELRYDAAGRLSMIKCIHEHLMPDDKTGVGA